MECVFCHQTTEQPTIALTCPQNHHMHVECGKGWVAMWRADGQPPSCPTCKHLKLKTPLQRSFAVYLDKTCSHCTDLNDAIGSVPSSTTDTDVLGFSRVVCDPCTETNTLFVHTFQTSCETGIREYVGSTMPLRGFCIKAALLDSWQESRGKVL